MIEVKNLTKRYGDHCAVDNLSFTVEDGQIYGFLGPNGAGKSTTMNIMTGYLAPTSGDVVINGYDILEEPEEAKKTIGYLPEIPPVYPDMTVREYLDFCAALKKVPKGERVSQVSLAESELGLEGVVRRLIKNLSKGFRQRVGFAEALLGNPETLILDEPTVGLDPKQIIEIRELIKKLGKTHTVILSSHILSEVSEVCDKVLIINNGTFVACDTPENLEKSEHEKAVLNVTAQGTVDTVLAAIRRVVRIPSSAVSADEKGLVHARIEVPAGEDIRGKVSQALLSAHCPIYEMAAEHASLENIFLDLTADIPAKQPPKTAEPEKEAAPEGDSTDGYLDTEDSEDDPDPGIHGYDHSDDDDEGEA